MATRDPEANPAAFLGDELRRVRLAAGFSSQDALAARMGFDRTVITKVESGDRPPTVEVLAAWNMRPVRVAICSPELEPSSASPSLATAPVGRRCRFFRATRRHSELVEESVFAHRRPSTEPDASTSSA